MIDADHVRLSALRGGDAPGAANFPGSSELVWQRIR